VGEGRGFRDGEGREREGEETKVDWRGGRALICTVDAINL